MKNVLAFVLAALMVLPMQAELMSGSVNLESELVFRTCAPGIKVMPRVKNMMVIYDVTMIPREGNVRYHWKNLDENGEPQSVWTRWRDDSTFTFTNPGKYLLEAFADAPGKERSSVINVTFEVGYAMSSMALGMILDPCGDRGYNVQMTSLYGEEVYYRWRHSEYDVWYKWRLFTEAVPFTEGGNYVLETHCANDIMGAYIEVPNVDYYRIGDVNHNGDVNMDDLTALVNMLVGNELVMATGDVNRDSVVSIDDLTTLINMLMK